MARRAPCLVVTAFLGVLALAAPAAAQVYRWIDGSGAINYSQGLDSVPPRFRSSAVIVGYERSPAAGAPAEQAPAGSRISFRPGQPIFVQARINDGASAHLMLDTGASRTVIKPSVLAAGGVSYGNAQRGVMRGVTGEAEVVAVRIDSLDVSGARFGPLMVISHDTGWSGRGDGLLGRDFLDHFTVTIDNTAGVVTLTPK